VVPNSKCAALRPIPTLHALTVRSRSGELSCACIYIHLSVTHSHTHTAASGCLTDDVQIRLHSTVYRLGRQTTAITTPHCTCYLLPLKQLKCFVIIQLSFSLLHTHTHTHTTHQTLKKKPFCLVISPSQMLSTKHSFNSFHIINQQNAQTTMR